MKSLPLVQSPLSSVLRLEVDMPIVRRAAIAIAAILVLSAPATRAAAASTLLVTDRPISTFAFGGHTIAWATQPCNFGSGTARLWTRNVATGRAAQFTSRGLGCGIVEAVTDRRVVNDGAIEATADWFETATLNRRRLVRVQSFDYQGAPGTMHGPVVSATRDFAYSWWSFDFQNPATCQTNGTGCDLVVTGGGLKLLSGQPPATAIPGAPPARLLSLSGGRVALLPYRIGTRFKTGAVQVRSVATGALVSSFVPAGAAEGIALDASTLAVMVRAPGGARHIEIRSATSGVLVSSFAVSRAAGNRIDLSDHGLVFRNRGKVRLLDPGDGVRRTIATGRRRLISWQIEGARVVWVVDGPRRGFVRTRMLG
jgi:hypothetical protein